MPAKKPSASKKKSQETGQLAAKFKNAYRSEKNKDFKILAIVLAVIVGVIFIIQCIVWLQGYNDELKGQKTIETYLEDKYEKDFVVEKPVHKGYGFAIEGVLEAVAYPKENPSLKFTATTNSRGSDDKYPGAFWHQQAYDYVSSLVTKTFGYTPNYTIRVVTYDSKNDAIKGHLSSFKEALAKYKSQIGLLIEVTSREEINATSKALVAQRTHEIAENIKSLEVAYISIKYISATGGGLSYSLGGPNYPELKPSQPKTIQELEALVKEGR